MLHRQLILSALAVLLITACSEDVEQQVSLTETARLIEKSEIAVSVENLSDIIIKQQNDYRLYDVRPAAEFNASHIKSAENVSGTELLSSKHIEDLSSGRKVVLYSEQSDKAAQHAVLLRTRGIPAYYLQGGYRSWSGQMSAAPSTDSASDKARKQAVACWFEGDYVAEAGLAVKSANSSGGYVPPLEPASVEPEPETDALGLGLGLGLGPEDEEPAAETSGGILKIGEGC